MSFEIRAEARDVPDAFFKKCGWVLECFCLYILRQGKRHRAGIRL